MYCTYIIYWIEEICLNRFWMFGTYTLVDKFCNTSHYVRTFTIKFYFMLLAKQRKCFDSSATNNKQERAHYKLNWYNGSMCTLMLM